MIPCDEVRRHLMDFHYDLLCEWQTEEIIRHLRRCPECRSQDAVTQRDMATFDRWKVHRPPAHLWAALAVRLRREVGRHYRRPPAWKRFATGLLPIPFAPAAMTALTIVVMLAGIRLWSIRHRDVLPIDVYAHDYLVASRQPHPGQFTAQTRLEMARWLETKTGFPTHSPNLCSEGLKLIGVRVCRLRGQAVGIWIYRMDGSMALLFERNDDGAVPPASTEINNSGHYYDLTIDAGLNLLSWKNQGRLFTFVAPGSPGRLSNALTHCLNREAIVGLSASAGGQ